jgi:hypothetical protein
MNTRLVLSLIVFAGLLWAVGSSWRSGKPSEPLGFAAPEVLFESADLWGHPHPHYADFDGDGIIDQLIGVRGQLMVFRNLGTNAKPRYDKPFDFDKIEPTGHLPGG